MRRSDRVGERWRVGVVLAAVAVLGSIPAGCGVDAGPPEVVGPLERPAAGTTLDGSRLPKPVSNLYAAGQLVEYLSITSEHELELVAVDPTAGRVRWRRPASVGMQPAGVPAQVSGIGANVAILAPSTDANTWMVQSIDIRGRVRWEAEVRRPVLTPQPCSGRICVDLSANTVSFPAKGGPELVGGRIASDMQVVAAEGGRSLVVDLGGRGEPAVALLGVPRFQRDGRWRRPLAEVFRNQRVSSTPGWQGSRFGDTWVLWLNHVSDLQPGEPLAYPYDAPEGSVAGLGVDDGASRWLRRGARYCGWPASDRVLILCEGQARYGAEGEVPTFLTTSLQRVDPSTGTTDFEVELREPLDLFDTDGRVLRLDRDRWLVRDRAEVHEVDFSARTTKRGSADMVGWCEQNTTTDEVRGPKGDLRRYADPWFLHPCTLEQDQPVRAELLAPIVDQRIGAPDDSTVAEVGPWVLWVEDGHLAGVATEG